jgi:hypothetical protein
MGQKLPENRGDPYRQRADQIRDMAKASPTEAVRRELEAIVMLYERLADDLDRPA